MPLLECDSFNCRLKQAIRQTLPPQYEILLTSKAHVPISIEVVYVFMITNLTMYAMYVLIL